MSVQHMVSVHITRGTSPTWAALLTWGLSNFEEFFCNSCSALALKTLQVDSSPYYDYSRTCIKGIPLFCTAHPLLRITLRHSRWRRFLPLARKEQTRAAFAGLKLLFSTLMPEIDWQLPGLPSKNKKMKEMCAISKSAVVFHFAAVELWNY